MTVLRGGVGNIWHIYEKDTGRGRNIIVRKAHSVQSSPNLQAWKGTVKEAAMSGYLTRAAHAACVKYANTLNEQARSRFYIVIKDSKGRTIERCKMSALRPFMTAALKLIADHRADWKTTYKDIDSMANAILDWLNLSAKAGGGGKTAEVRGVWF